MISFHKVSMEDRDWIKEKLNAEPRRGCEYSFGNIFCYAEKYALQVAEVEGCFVSKSNFGAVDGYCFPIGGDKSKAAKRIVEEACALGRKAVFYGISEEDKAVMERTFPGRFFIRENRDLFDYVYLTEDLVSLAGKKYQSKRNHISFFKRNSRWQYERITPETIPECLAMSERWLEENKNEFQHDLEEELEIIKIAFRHYEALGLVGGLLRVDGQVIAYAMGEKLTDDMFCVHFEKAFPDIRGAYPMINQQFVEQELAAFRYVNREDDVGHDNLRKAKLSYHPALMVEKYEMRIC